MARRWRKKHEPDHFGARVQRDIEGFRRPQTANLDGEMHA
jgi:hypothetical protein